MNAACDQDASVLALSQAALDVPAVGSQAEVDTLAIRVKNVEALNARNGISVFSTRLAGLLTATRSPFAASFMPEAAVAVGVALGQACSADLMSLPASLCRSDAQVSLRVCQRRVGACAERLRKTR